MTWSKYPAFLVPAGELQNEQAVLGTDGDRDQDGDGSGNVPMGSEVQSVLQTPNKGASV